MARPYSGTALVSDLMVSGSTAVNYGDFGFTSVPGWVSSGGYDDAWDLTQHD